MSDIKVLNKGKKIGYKIFEKTCDPRDYVKYVGGFNDLIAEKQQEQEVENQPGM